MTAYEGPIGDMLRTVGGEELVDRLSNANLPDMLRRSGTAARRRARSFEMQLIEIHRTELGKLFADLGIRLLSANPSCVFHWKVDVERDVTRLEPSIWQRQARAELERSRLYSTEYLHLLEPCLDRAQHAPHPNQLLRAATQLSSTPGVRLRQGVGLRLSGETAPAARIYHEVTNPRVASSLLNSYAWHGVALTQLTSRDFDGALRSFRTASQTIELRPTPVAYWLALSYALQETREVMESARRLDQLVDGNNALLDEIVNGIAQLAKIGAWPRAARKQIGGSMLGPAARRICNAMA